MGFRMVKLFFDLRWPPKVKVNPKNFEVKYLKNGMR